MFDLAHQWGGDLTVSPFGDLELVSGQSFTTQRLYRRLLTNSGAYIWHLNYGGGLATFIGTPGAAGRIKAIILNQIDEEDSIAVTPAPAVSVQLLDPGTGYVVANVRYTDRSAAATRSVTFQVGQQQ